MDAVSFAVGVQSKDLRGRLLKDLIYRSTTDDGTGARRPIAPSDSRSPSVCHLRRPTHVLTTLCWSPAPAAEERSASVTLVYECDGEETKFTRSIKKDGVGEYRIDGKARTFGSTAASAALSWSVSSAFW